MYTTERPPVVSKVRLSAADLLATLLVVTAMIVSILWLTDAALTGWSIRVVAAVVFGLGYLGCMTARARMLDVYGARGHRRAPMAYVVAASLVGAVALVSAGAALVWATETMLVVLTVAIFTLWGIATARHLTTTA
jgi:hypothetical protein